MSQQRTALARLPTVLFALFVLFGIMSTQSVLAESWFEKLVMPGELITGHANLEKDCRNCHESFSQHTQSRLCLGCHKPIAADIDARKGFHGRQPTIRDTECRHCHTDHKGRQADIVGLDPQTFRHDVTDFPLKGAHVSVACESCHQAGKPRRTAPLECVGCHKKDEPHGGRLGKTCDGCHSVDAWKPTLSFDHGRTKFPLVGAHKSIACRTCHSDEQWKGLDVACVTCHRLKDAHGGRYGEKCETCHGSEKWSAIRFDHDKATKFPLLGEHRKLNCNACHTGNIYRDKLQTACVSCHKKQDVHQSQLGSACERCHTEKGWRQKVDFDHDLTSFPLIGLHAAVPCEGCHVTQEYKTTPRSCTACHKDIHHEGRLGSRCEACHNPNGWKLFQFDHGKQTRFPLMGAHSSLSCHACHREKNPPTLVLPQDCYSCHSQDDIHRGAFGRNCATCHSTAAFSEPMRRR